MKTVAILMLLALALAIYGCGTGTPSPTITTTTGGYWEAQLTGGLGVASQLNFVTQFTVTATNGTTANLDITGLSFINEQAWFPSGPVPSGSATITVLSTNQVTGTMTYAVSSGSGGNQLALNGTNVYGTASGTPGTTGTLSNGVVTGSWTLTGPCTNSASPPPQGDFIMCQGAATCTVP